MPDVTEQRPDEPQPALTEQPGKSGIPAWLRQTEGEQRWWVAISLMIAIALQALVPDRFTVRPKLLLPSIELVALIVLVATHPDRMSRRTPQLRLASQLLLALIAITNAVSVFLLVRQITSGGDIPAVELLLGGAEIWLTNTIVFGLWYWEYDRGGPASRALGLDAEPDLLFPQMADPSLGPDWEPTFVDYLYVSYTNSTAFSPTDTMPLSHWVKLLFMAQSTISLITVGLIAARAVNILPGP
jgi:uncharacterized membrane protein